LAEAPLNPHLATGYHFIRRRGGPKTAEQLESKIQSRFIARCKAHGWDAWKEEAPGTAGIPDVLVLVTDIKGRGHSVFVELKSPGKEPTKLQEHRLNELKRRGFVAFWLDDEALAFAHVFTACKKVGIKL